VLLPLHRGQRPAGEQIGALHEKVEHLRVEGPVILLDRLERLGRRGVAHDDVHRPQAPLDRREQAVDLGLVGHVGPKHLGRDPVGAEGGERLVGLRLGVGVVDRDLRPGQAEAAGRRAAEARGRARDERRAAVE